ncbi:hypothetical protein Riv7116_1737 [Rivularia sp. PCC 7116]|uniref:hypothetical protein n=1 Tax=Rivularia sp. PCC 7116 TaxID=373994 RepID=UPI00029F093B|nr:hypothetical protein [Rivularia sp. PCC 7116]AFY54282.1 hypothetical protein Riv7116_1737 [Rivularia sp. PCC 7116]
MVKKIINYSSKASAVLSQYPKWLEMVIEAQDKPVLDKNYCPHVIEIFDQHGLLAGKINGLSAYECTRDIQQKSDFNAWLLDGQLAVFYVGSKLIINRLEAVAVVNKGE